MDAQKVNEYFAMVEEAWKLSDEAREFIKQSQNPDNPMDYWVNVFSRSSLVDVQKTQREGGNPLARIYLNSPYGLQWRAEYKDWIPFRHGDIKFN